MKPCKMDLRNATEDQIKEIDRILVAKGFKNLHQPIAEMRNVTIRPDRARYTGWAFWNDFERKDVPEIQVEDFIAQHTKQEAPITPTDAKPNGLPDKYSIFVCSAEDLQTIEDTGLVDMDYLDKPYGYMYPSTHLIHNNVVEDWREADIDYTMDEWRSLAYDKWLELTANTWPPVIQKTPKQKESTEQDRMLAQDVGGRAIEAKPATIQEPGSIHTVNAKKPILGIRDLSDQDFSHLLGLPKPYNGQ